MVDPPFPSFRAMRKFFFQGSSFLPNMSWKDEGLGKLSLAVLHCLLVISQLLCNFFSVTRMDWGHGSDRLRAKGMKGEVQMHIIWEKGKLQTCCVNVVKDSDVAFDSILICELWISDYWNLLRRAELSWWWLGKHLKTDGGEGSHNRIKFGCINKLCRILIQTTKSKTPF